MTIRRSLALFSTLALGLGVSVLRSPIALAAAPCTTTVTTNYTVQVCLTSPAPGATLSGPTTVSATATVQGGSATLSFVSFDIDGNALASNFVGPTYSFTWHTAHWVDGLHTIGAYAVMSDGTNTENSPAPGGPAAESVSLANGTTAQPTNNNQPTITTGTTPPAGQPLVVGAVGSGADGSPGSNNVANEVAGWSPNLFLFLGDVYERATYEEFYNWYDPAWGKMRSITNPVLGDQESYYGQGQVSAYGIDGYHWYWNNEPNYYSYDAGGWHFIALEGCEYSSDCSGSAPEITWLNNDLAAHTGACIVAYSHEPRYALWYNGGTPSEQPLWAALANSHATVMVNADRHYYERWTAMDANGNTTPTGMAEFVVGTGNHNFDAPIGSDSRMMTSITNTPGALKLSISKTSAAFQFISLSGAVGDSGSIPCQGSGNLTGQVTDAATSAPLAGATVSYSGTGPAGPVTGSATTDSTGHYSVNGIAVTSYSLTAQASGYGSQSTSATIGGASTTTQNFALTSQATTLTGTVTDASTGKAIAGATVSAGGSTATSNGSGVYTISGLAPGTYTATASANGYAAQSASVTLNPGATTTQNFALAPNPGTITGSVTNAANGSPIVGATVSYSGGSTTTDGTGSYTLAGVSEGSYAVTAAASGYQSQTQNVTVGPGATATQNFALTAPNGSITGTVTDASTGNPIAGAGVSYSGGSTTTNASGQYTLSSVPPGTYSVTASAAGYSSSSQSVTVATGSAATANFALWQAPFFSDGFESGGLSSWSSASGLSIESSTIHAGSYAAEGSTINGTTYALKQLGTTYNSVYYRSYFDLKSQTTGFTLMGLQGANGTGIIRVYVDPQGHLVLWNDVTQLTTTGPAITLGSWHSVELHVNINGALSTTQVWLDGANIPAFASSSAALGVLPVGQIQLGSQASLQIYDVVFDDVALSTNRTGP